MGLSLGIYVFIGILTRTSNPDQYYVAGRGVPSVYNGMATGSDWMSAASFISMAGALAVQGFGGLAYVMGWTGGACCWLFFSGHTCVSSGPTPFRISSAPGTAEPRPHHRRGGGNHLLVHLSLYCPGNWRRAYRVTLHRAGLQHWGVCWPPGRAVLLGVGWDAVGYLDASSPVYHSDYLVSGAGGVPVLVALWHPHSRIDLRQAPTAQQRHRHPADGRPEGERDPGAVEKDADEIAARLKTGGLPGL